MAFSNPEPEYYYAECWSSGCYWEGENRETANHARTDKHDHEQMHKNHNPVVMQVFDDGSEGRI
jgi:hypothetical protein